MKNIEIYSLTKLGIEDGWGPKQIEWWNGKILILGNDYLISTEINSEIKSYNRSQYNQERSFRARMTVSLSLHRMVL